MTTPDLSCPDCGATHDAPDNYCRQCGMYLAALRAIEPVDSRSRALEPARPGLPAPMKKVVTAVAVGTALQIGVGLAGKYLASQAARKATHAIAPRPRPRKAREADPAPASDPAQDAGAVSETLMIRRVWIRRP